LLPGNSRIRFNFCSIEFTGGETMKLKYPILDGLTDKEQVTELKRYLTGYIDRTVERKKVLRTKLKENNLLFKKHEQATDDLVKTQCSNGNWNYDAYMHGMANGMILIQSLFKNKPAVFLKAPKIWLENIKSNEKPVKSGG